MAQPVQFQRTALLELLRGPWTQLWIVAPRISAAAVGLIMPSLRRDGAQIRVLTDLSPGRLAEGKVEMMALQELRSLPGCEVRSLPELSACLYATGDGPALVTAAPLTLEGLDSPYQYGALLPDGGALLPDLKRWWQQGARLTESEWVNLAVETSQRLEARSVANEIIAVGAFVRVSVRNTRRSRTLDPKEFGVTAEGEGGRAVRPAAVSLFKLDDVIRAKDELEAILAEEGLEWNGYYLVPRPFLERDWPRVFGAREKQLRERLSSPDAKAAFKRQLAQAREDLAGYFGELYPRAETEGMTADAWIDQQVTRVLTEAVSGSILSDTGLEYRILAILPEDERSVEELSRLLQDQKLRSLQLTFNF